MRIYPARYGFYLHEFDPYFDYYASDYIVDKYEEKGILGMFDYFSWTDNMTWFPSGRDVASTSQVGLHFAGAILYILATNIFGLSISLYDLLVLFPVFIGSLTSIIIYLLVKRISSASAGLLAGLVIAFSPPIIQRGALGWYKSEPLALFLVVLGSYFFLTIYDEKASKIGLLLRASVSGILLGFANTAWGGSMYFNAVFGALFFLIPFLKVDLRKTVYLGSVFVSFYLIFSAMFPRPGPNIISGPGGIALLGGLIFAMISYRIKSTVDSRIYFRSIIKAAFVFGLIAMVVTSMGAISSLSGRYETVLDPFMKSEDPLVESVAEHQTPTGADYLSSYMGLLFLAGFGAVMTMRKRNIAAWYTLVLALSAIYISSSFARLMVYSSLAIAILSGIGLHELNSAVFKNPAVSSIKKIRFHKTRSEVKVIYGIFMVVILTLPIVNPNRENWLETADAPVSIASSSTNFRMDIPDWREALSWIRYSTPSFQQDGKPTVFASWWDYGYWIAVMGNRTTLADNATINSTRISTLGRMFMSEETQSMEILRQLGADYVVIYIVGQSFTQGDQKLFLLGVSGDESKKQWFIKIGGLDINTFLEEDEFTPKPYFWENTFLGKMMPFNFVGYAEFTAEGLQFSEKTEYERGFRAIYTYNLKYPAEGEGPLRLAFMSSSLAELKDGLFAGVLIYEIVK